MLEVFEKEGTFDFEIYKALLLYHLDPQHLPTDETCLVGFDVESIMEMFGLPLSQAEKKQREYNQPVTKTTITLTEAFNVYEYVRAKRLLVLLQTSQAELKKIAKKKIQLC